MTHSWREKLDEKGLEIVEVNAKMRQIGAPANAGFEEIRRWTKKQNAVLDRYPELEQKRKANLDPKFIPLFLKAHPDIELNKQEMQHLFEKEEMNVLRAEELELMQRIALELEGDQTKRMEAYEALAGMVVLLRHLFAGSLKKQLGTKPRSPSQFFWAIARNLKWVAGILRGSFTEPPGRVNVELASLADAIMEHRKEPLTQIELYEALKAAGAELPDDPEAFRLWLHRARKQGLVKNFDVRPKRE